MNNTFNLFFTLLLVIAIGFLPLKLEAVLIKPEAVQRTPEQIKQSVVKIRANNTGREGSGFVVDVSNREAYIITVSHVVTGEPNPTVEFFGNKKFKAEVLDSEPSEGGLALLFVKGKIPYDSVPLFLAESYDPKLGDEFYTIGFPRGGARWSYDKLLYSAQKLRELQFSGNLNGGNSGSPIIKGGQAIAIVTSVTNYVFAVSSERILYFLRGTVLGGTKEGGAQLIEEMKDWAHPNVIDSQIPRGTVLAFATLPGTYAFSVQDGGRYTINLLKAMEIPNLEIESMLKQVQQSVERIEMERSRQKPWHNSNYTGTFCFTGCLENYSSQLNKNALIIGNTARHIELSIRNDVKNMSNSLEKKGFNTISILNLKYNEMKMVIADFIQRLSVQKGIGLFYFSGNGDMYRGKDIIYPYNSSNSSLFNKKELIFVDSIVNQMENANKTGLNIIILDSSRSLISDGNDSIVETVPD